MEVPDNRHVDFDESSFVGSLEDSDDLVAPVHQLVQEGVASREDAVDQRLQHSQLQVIDRYRALAQLVYQRPLYKD